MPALCHTKARVWGQWNDYCVPTLKELGSYHKLWFVLGDVYPGVNSVTYLLHAGLAPNLYYFQYSETTVEKTPHSYRGFPLDPSEWA